MRGRWQQVIESVLRPARPHLARCLAARDDHFAQHRPHEEARTRALRDCMRRIETSRATAFAANDGVVPVEMNALEREWRRLSRDTERGVMELWARIAPPAWIDRKRWRDTTGELRIDAAVALAADPEGVEAAESAVASLRAALTPWGVPFGPKVRFRMQEHDEAHRRALFEAPLQSLDAVVPHAESVEREIHALALERLSDRPDLASDLAHAAFVECVWQACERAPHASPVEPLRALWGTGYVISTIDRAGVTLEIPRL